MNGSFTQVDASMERWRLEATPIVAAGIEAAGPSDPLHAIYREWGFVHDFSNVDVQRFDGTFGARHRLDTGWAFELAYTYTDYEDFDPILEDETGTYSSVMGLVGKAF
jgi:hypothetical protein